MPSTQTLILLTLGLFAVVGVGASAAQTVPYDHVHMAAPDPAKAVAWYKDHLGGMPGELPDRVVVNKVLLIWMQRADSPASEGSVIDHIGFSVPDVNAKVAELQAAGARLVTPARDAEGLFRIAFVEDPWGAKLEILQDTERLGLHHLHLRLPDPDKGLAWFAERFGGERAKLKGRLDGLRYDGLWLLAQKADAAPGSTGRAIDHLGWRVRDITTAFAMHRTKGDKIAGEPRPVRDLQVGFIEDPNGVRIEVLQRPQY